MRWRRPRPAPSSTSTLPDRAYHSGRRSAEATTSHICAAAAGMVLSRSIFTTALPPNESLHGWSRLYAMANKSTAEQFDALYGRLWRAFIKPDADDLSQHERQLLHHVPAVGGIPLGGVPNNHGIQMSKASEQVTRLKRHQVRRS